MATLIFVFEDFPSTTKSICDLKSPLYQLLFII